MRRSFSLSMEGLGGGGGEEEGKIWRIQKCFWSHLCLYSFWKWGVVPHFPFPSFTFTFWWLCHCGWCHSLSVYHLKRRRLPWKLVENKCPKFQIQFNGSQKSKATENQTSRRGPKLPLNTHHTVCFMLRKCQALLHRWLLFLCLLTWFPWYSIWWQCCEEESFVEVQLDMQAAAVFRQIGKSRNWHCHKWNKFDVEGNILSPPEKAQNAPIN